MFMETPRVRGRPVSSGDNTMQHLDDVTGDPIRLNARQRELQREAMVEMINMQTRQLNALTAELRRLSAGLETEAQARRDAIAVQEARRCAFETRSLMARLRWLVLGR